MKGRLVYHPHISNNIFQHIAIVVLICIISIANFSTAFADGHEMEGETAEEKPKVTGWFQIDVDSLGTYFLVGASHPLSGGISFDSNIYVNDHLGEFDMGISFPVIANDSMALLLTPMLGVGFNYVSPDGPYALYPQIFAILPAGKIFGFHWTIATLSSPFGGGEEVTHVIKERKVEHDIRGASDTLYNRTYFTYALNDTVAVGPQFESVLGLGDGGGLWALNFGGRVNIGYGENNTLGIYVGYETKKEEGQTGLTGRMNFTRRW